MKNKAAVILINFNAWHDTIECLESLLRIDYTNYFIIVYDNGSSDSSLEHLLKWAEGKEGFTPPRGRHKGLVYPLIKKPLPCHLLDSGGKTLKKSGALAKLYLVRGNKNLGFAGGNNAAIEIALDKGANILALLNNDTVVERGFLKPLVDFLLEDKKHGAAGGAIFYYSRPEKIWAAGGGFLNPLTARSRHFLLERPRSALPEKPCELDYTTGCLMAVRADTIKRAGKMDEDYFLYYEESDWAMKLHKAGYGLFLVPSSRVYHKVSTTTERSGSLIVKYYFTRNRIHFIKKNFRGLKRRIALVIVTIHCISRVIFHMFVKMNGRKARLLARALRDGLSGRMGEYLP
jgi:hypothetical protein